MLLSGGMNFCNIAYNAVKCSGSVLQGHLVPNSLKYINTKCEMSGAGS